MTAGRRRAGRGRLDGGARAGCARVAECDVPRAAESAVLRAANAKPDTKLERRRRAARRAIDAICGKGTEYCYASAL